jgi:hypothetical protein
MIPQQTMMNGAFPPQTPPPLSADADATLTSTRQDAQMNYLSTLSIFTKQTTYLATLPNPKIW